MSTLTVPSAGGLEGNDPEAGLARLHVHQGPRPLPAIDSFTSSVSATALSAGMRGLHELRTSRPESQGEGQ